MIIADGSFGFTCPLVDGFVEAAAYPVAAAAFITHRREVDHPDDVAALVKEFGRIDAPAFDVQSVEAAVSF